MKQEVWAGGNSAPGRGDLRPAPAPADRSAERKLRRGNIEIEARADLHGLTQDQARAALGRFLHSAKARGLRSVLVITGKGGRPADRARDVFESEPGILRRRLPQWLAEPDLRAIVSGYSPAHRRHGGEGAFYVLLKAR
ncbi:MAG: Smr/MutS family protein [Maricaulaceae bacterium]|nr:Smr/MutS family protein [Maricaulaceae bacterium]